MSLLAPLLAADPASPRLTVYDETAGTRMDFSATTLDNWANKIANMLIEEFGLDPLEDDPDEFPTIVVDLPVSWQCAVIAIGIYNADLRPRIITTGEEWADETRLVFTTPDRVQEWTGRAMDIVAVSDDPFGRGVVESGGELPAAAMDFGPTVRFYGDQFYGYSPDLDQFALPEVTAERFLVPGWRNTPDFGGRVMVPLAAGGSVVVITGVASTDRIEQIKEAEKVTAQRP